MKKIAAVALLILALLPAAPATAITVCADPDPPPWTYWVRDANNKPTKEFVGASVDLLREVFSRLKLPVRFVGNFPWSRCLHMVETGQIDFAMDAYYDEERARTFAYSIHYNTLTPQVFYRADNPLKIRSTDDLRRYRGCGMLGASYAHYGLRNENLDLGVNTYDGMVQKLLAKRCDYFVEEYEVIVGNRKLGRDYLANTPIRHAPVPGAEAPAKHLIAARNGEARKLLPKIDAELKKMIHSGTAARIWKKHAPEFPYKP